MKPEEAIPKCCEDERGLNLHREYFTAAETAAIARSYASARYKENRYAEIGMKHKTASEWRAKFKEWDEK